MLKIDKIQHNFIDNTFRVTWSNSTDVSYVHITESEATLLILHNNWDVVEDKHSKSWYYKEAPIPSSFMNGKTNNEQRMKNN